MGSADNGKKKFLLFNADALEVIRARRAFGKSVDFMKADSLDQVHLMLSRGEFDYLIIGPNLVTKADIGIGYMDAVAVAQHIVFEAFARGVGCVVLMLDERQLSRPLMVMMQNLQLVNIGKTCFMPIKQGGATVDWKKVRNILL